MRRAPAAPGDWPPGQQVTVGALARPRTQEHDRPRHGWSLDEIAATVLNEAHAAAISRATAGRRWPEADPPPPQSA